MDLLEYHKRNRKQFRRHPWEMTRVDILLFFIRSLSGPVRHILDIGSGDAFIAACIAAEFPDASVAAIDTHYDEATIAAISQDKPANLSLFQQSGQANLPGKADLVVLMDVLEHVEHPEQLLGELLRHPSVGPETKFFITVPAYQFLFTRHDELLGHYKRYTFSSLRKLLSDNELEDIRGTYCFNSLLVPRYISKLKEKISGRKTAEVDGIHNWKQGSFITTVLKKLMVTEFKFTWYLSRAGIRIPGLTCYCICKPSR